MSTGPYFIKEETELVPEREHSVSLHSVSLLCLSFSTGDLRLKLQMETQSLKPLLSVAWFDYLEES